MGTNFRQNGVTAHRGNQRIFPKHTGGVSGWNHLRSGLGRDGCLLTRDGIGSVPRRNDGTYEPMATCEFPKARLPS